MPILKVDPLSGQSLDLNKTPKQIAAENAANEKFYTERKKRSKGKKKVEHIAYEPIVIVNPILAQNNEPSVEDLLEPFTKLINKSSAWLRKEVKEYKLTGKNLMSPPLTLNKVKGPLKVNYDSDLSTYKHIPISIEYVPTITVPPSVYDVFPEKIMPYQLFLLVDRIMFTTLDIKTLLKYPKESKKLLDKLIKEMYTNIVDKKFLNKSKKYTGNTVAAIKINNYKDEYIEVQMFSDASEVIS